MQLHHIQNRDIKLVFQKGENMFPDNSEHLKQKQSFKRFLERMSNHKKEKLKVNCASSYHNNSS